tara:strand:+ start:183 stop:647 length:465 start_codon:yes stop_codon:yes gene_type:complete
MKKSTIVLFSLFATLSVSAQEVVAMQGDSYTNGDVSMDFTIGEVIINTGTDGSTDITQGLHQTTWTITALDGYSVTYEATVFPNPTADVLNIQTSNFEDVAYSVYDVKGLLVKQGILSAEETPIQVSELASGSYSLILNNGTQNLKTFKLVKTH